MNDKKIKTMLKKAYQISPSQREKDFLKKNEKRTPQLFDIITLEFKYLRLNSFLSAGILIVIFYLISMSENPKLMWYVSGALPVIGLLLLANLGKSEKYGMHELESSSRFSLKFIKTVRMFILGLAAITLIITVSVMLQGKTCLSFASVLGFVGTPYMINVWGNLLITRRWHGKGNISGCLSITVLSCMLPILIEKAICLQVIRPFFITVLLVIISFLAVRESILYIKEREDLLWNYC